MVIENCLVSFVAVMGFGGMVADLIAPKSAAQHIFNPLWKPHAKLHNAQAFISGVILGIIALCVLFLKPNFTSFDFVLAVAISSVYWVAMLLASFVPQTAWVDPEFEGYWPELLGKDLNFWLCIFMVTILLIALTLRFLL